MSPLLFLVNSTFTEIQQGVLLTIALITLIKRNQILCILFVALSITTKESFIFLWSVVIIFNLSKESIHILQNNSQQISSQPFIQNFGKNLLTFLKDFIKSNLYNTQIRVLVIGLLIGSTINFSFNFIKFNQFKNMEYISENRLFEMNMDYFITNFKWAVFSPNGGIVFSYGLFLSIILLHLMFHKSIQSALHIMLSSKNNDNIESNDLIHCKQSLKELVIFIFLFLVVGLSTTSAWWATFGWDTWGYRLITPYFMPVAIIAILWTKKYIEYSERLIRIFRSLPVLDHIPRQKNLSIVRHLVIILAILLALCGLSYNLVTIQTLYRKDINTLVASLHSQPSCRKMVSDNRGIVPYYWDCAMARFQYVPILHYPPGIIGFEGRKLFLIALISLIISIIGSGYLIAEREHHPTSQ
jgi:hypothetical protein